MATKKPEPKRNQRPNRNQPPRRPYLQPKAKPTSLKTKKDRGETSIQTGEDQGHSLHKGIQGAG